MTRPPDRGAPFPPESEWLSLAPPSVSPQFVGLTLARLRDVGLVRRDPLDESADRAFARLDVPRERLATEVPPTSAGFVEAVMAARTADRDHAVRSLLPHYEVPSASPEFVARTLRALRAEPQREWRRRLVLAAGACVAVAAAAAVAIMLLLPTPRTGFEQLLARPDAANAASLSPSVLSHLLAAAEPVGDALPIAPPDATHLWLFEGSR